MKTLAIFLIAAAVAAAIAFAGCDGGAGKDSRKRQLTERERDSTIAASKLPGAGAVAGAIGAADSAAARSSRLDSLGD